jgi:LPXTG-motif cell wall-anchored protein
MPDWTDQNQHDPGVTALELLAWLAAGLLSALGLYAYLRRRRDRD